MVHFKPKVLIAEDDEAFAEQLAESLKSENYNVIIAHDGSEALKILKNSAVDLGFIDLSMPGIDGMQVLEQAQTTAPDVPLIMITGYASIEKAVQATKLGAYDFIEKPVSLDRLLLTAKHALEKRKLQLQNYWMAEEILSRYEMIGTSQSMQEIYDLIDKIAPTNSTVLITGETGTGKELVTRALHARSKRADGPFVRINCAAIPDNLLESELFGYKKGAFTNAFQDKKGKIEMANQGSLFLDEIGDLSPSSQAKILRTLEDHVITPIGGVDDLEIDVRIFAATNKNLSELIEQGLFRADLFYRLQTIEISLPTLAEKNEDIPQLAQYFLTYFCAENNKYIKGFTAGAMHLLMQQQWPGNVRQLKSTIERLVILSSSEEITVDEISLVLKTQSVMNMRHFETYQEAEHAFQRDFFTQALHAHNWNVSETAKSLKIDRTNLYKKMQKLGIKNEKGE